MNIDKNTITVIASATAVTVSAVSSVIVSINARKNRVTNVHNHSTSEPVQPFVDPVETAMIEALDGLPINEKLRGLQAIKDGNFKSFAFHLRDI